MKLEYLFWHARTKRRVPLEELQRLLEEDRRIEDARERRLALYVTVVMIVGFLAVIVAPFVHHWLAK